LLRPVVLAELLADDDVAVPVVLAAAQFVDASVVGPTGWGSGIPTKSTRVCCGTVGGRIAADAPPSRTYCWTVA